MTPDSRLTYACGRRAWQNGFGHIAGLASRTGVLTCFAQIVAIRQRHYIDFSPTPMTISDTISRGATTPANATELRLVRPQPSAGRRGRSTCNRGHGNAAEHGAITAQWQRRTALLRRTPKFGSGPSPAPRPTCSMPCPLLLGRDDEGSPLRVQRSTGFCQHPVRGDGRACCISTFGGLESGFSSNSTLLPPHQSSLSEHRYRCQAKETERSRRTRNKKTYEMAAKIASAERTRMECSPSC